MVDRVRPKGFKPKKLKPKTEPGRPSTYLPEYVSIARVLCEGGATNSDLARAFGKSTSTIENWMCAYPDFRAAVCSGKSEVFDPRVERSLAHRAIGYTVMEDRVVGKKVIQVAKHYPPDPTSCIFWLKNRKPEQWKDVYEQKHSGQLDITKMSASDLLEEIKRDAEALGIEFNPGKGGNGSMGVAPAHKTVQ